MTPSSSASDIMWSSPSVAAALAVPAFLALGASGRSARPFDEGEPAPLDRPTDAARRSDDAGLAEALERERFVARISARVRSG